MNRIQFVRHESYTFPSSRGKVVIRRNQFDPARWDLLIGGVLVRKAYYSEPHEASEDASRNDFGDASINQRYAGLNIPSDLQSFWKYSSESTYVPVNPWN